jgi:hypothetical protein
LQRAQALVATLQSLVTAYTSTDPAIAGTLDNARSKAQDAVDALSAQPPDPARAAQKLQDMATKVQDAVNLYPGLDPAQGATLMDEGAAIARELATNAIDAAIARGGGLLSILAAQTSRTSGDTVRLLGDYITAIGDYQSAISAALGA